MDLEGLVATFSIICTPYIFPYSRIIHLRAVRLSVDICTVLQYVRVRLGGYISEGQGLCVENPSTAAPRGSTEVEARRGRNRIARVGAEIEALGAES